MDPSRRPAAGAQSDAPPRGLLARIPLYAWVLIAVVVAVPTGLLLGEDARGLELLPRLIIRGLTALATPLVVLAILSTIVTNEVRGRQGLRMMLYYLGNTLVALLIAILLSNLVQPGVGANLVLGEFAQREYGA